MFNNLENSVSQENVEKAIIILNNDMNSRILQNGYQGNPDVGDARVILLLSVYKELFKRDHKDQISELLRFLVFDLDNFYLYYLIGYNYKCLNLLDHALTFFNLGLKYNKSFFGFYLEIGLIYHGLNNALSAKYLEKALEFSNDFKILSSLSLVYLDSYKYTEAEKIMKIILSRPDASEEIRNKTKVNLRTIQALSGIVDESDFEPIYNGLTELQNKLLILNQTTSDSFEEHLKINDYFKDIKRYSHSKEPLQEQEHLETINDYFKDLKSLETFPRKIKIGYVSSDFYNHVIHKFIYTVLKDHDRSVFEVYIFSNTKTEDAVTCRLKEFDLKWFNIYNISDQEAGKMIHDQSIDILIDLNGHTQGNRLGIFAMKPARIQVSYLGYPNTIGLSEIDYMIVDNITNPLSSQQRYSEKLIRLPCCFLKYTMLEDFAIEPKDTSRLTFGLFNRPSKNNKKLLEAWKEIFRRVPESRVIVKLKTLEISEEVSNFYSNALGLSFDRLQIIPFDPINANYYKLFNKIDVLLDTWPYSGTTTTCDSLYMNVPVITLYDPNCHATNVSSSILYSAGLSEFITYSVEEYIEKCCNLDTKCFKDYRSCFLKSNDLFMMSYESGLMNLVL